MMLMLYLVTWGFRWLLAIDFLVDLLEVTGRGRSMQCHCQKWAGGWDILMCWLRLFNSASTCLYCPYKISATLMEFSVACCFPVWPSFSGSWVVTLLLLLTGQSLEVSADEWCLFALPLQLGGLGICNPVSLAFRLYDSSIHCTEHLIRSIVRFESFELDSHFECVSIHKVNHWQQLSVIFNDEFCQLLPIIIWFFAATGYSVGQGH